jgi:hypothetical protein
MRSTFGNGVCITELAYTHIRVDSRGYEISLRLTACNAWLGWVRSSISKVVRFPIL